MYMYIQYCYPCPMCRVYGYDDELITVNQMYEVGDRCSVESTRPHRTLSCVMRDGIRWIWLKIRMILLSKSRNVSL